MKQPRKLFKDAGRTSAMIVLRAALWLLVFFYASVSSSIFGAFHCLRFVEDSDQRLYREFLAKSLDIECPSDGHA
eukprot:scaffold159687_cov48-Tisochrysis_lutea.AAC.1